MEALGLLGVIVALVLIASGILAIFIPFMIYSALGKMDVIIKLLEAIYYK